MKSTTDRPVKRSTLEVRAQALEELSKANVKIGAAFKAHYDQFIGQDIFKVDGSVKQKFKFDLSPYRTPHGTPRRKDGTFLTVSAYEEMSYHSFKVNVKVCLNGGSYEDQPSTAYCNYEENTLYIYDVKDGAIVENVNHVGKFGGKVVKYNLEKLKKQALKLEKMREKYEAEAEKTPHLLRDDLRIKRFKY